MFKRHLVLVIAILFLGGCGQPVAEDGASPKNFRHVTASPGFEDAEKRIFAGAKQAAKLQLRPFVYFTASWCPPCQAIKESMDDERMTDAFAGTYIIEFDIDEWSEIPDDYEVGAIPVYYEVDFEGKPTGRKIDGGAWGENIPANMAPPLKKFFHDG